MIWSSSICLVKIELDAIFVASTLLSAIFAVVTTFADRCIVSILPVISSALSTEFAPNCVEVILPSAILAAVTALSAIFAVVTLASVILAVVTASVDR